MSTTSTLPELDVQMIWNLILWAEKDDAFMASHEAWGQWLQTQWGVVDQNSSYRLESPEIAQQIRNGACETAYCMAGQTVWQHGYRLEYEVDRNSGMVFDLGGEEVRGYNALYCMKQEPTGQYDEKGRAIWRDVPGEELQSIGDTAMNLLGLTSDERYKFFHEDNKVDDLKAYANWMCQTRNIPLLYPNDDIFDPCDDDN